MTDPRGKDRAGAVRGGAGGRGHDTVRSAGAPARGLRAAGGGRAQGGRAQAAAWSRIGKGGWELDRETRSPARRGDGGQRQGRGAARGLGHLAGPRFRSCWLSLRSLRFILSCGHGKPLKNIKPRRDIIWVILGKFLTHLCFSFFFFFFFYR